MFDQFNPLTPQQISSLSANKREIYEEEEYQFLSSLSEEEFANYIKYLSERNQ